MVFTCKAVLLGIDKKVSTKGNEYSVALLQQGVDTLRCMVKMKAVPPDLKKYTEFEFELSQSSYNGQIRLDVTDIKKIA